jgi:H+/Cl- antiporter ClcA
VYILKKLIAALVATAFLAGAPALAKTSAPKAAHHGTVAKKAAVHKLHKTAAKKAAKSKMAGKSKKTTKKGKK